MTVAEMKIGERLFLGKYSAGDNCEPISWLKATGKNMFLSEFVLDYLTYDAKESKCGDFYRSYYGNSAYEESNIFQFLNSDQEDWFHKMHDRDEPPGRKSAPFYPYASCSGDYAHKPGFLTGFQPYERECIAGKVMLPHIDDVYGFRKFELFKRRGVRGKFSEDALEMKSGFGYSANHFVPYMTRSAADSNRIWILGRGGQRERLNAIAACGVRPQCFVRGDTQIKRLDDGTGYVLEQCVVSSREVCSADDIKTLLGLL